MNTDDMTPCRYCGEPVMWRISQKGKRYLAVKHHIYNEDGRCIKVIFPVHQCLATTEEKAAIEQRLQSEHEQAIQNGEIVRGQKVIITKGRKYPIGTVGTLDWIAREQDRFGVMQVRMVLDDGTKIYVNRANIEVAVQSAAN